MTETQDYQYDANVKGGLGVLTGAADWDAATNGLDTLKRLFNGTTTYERVPSFLDESILKSLAFSAKQVELIAWGTVFPSFDEAAAAKKILAMPWLKRNQKKAPLELHIPIPSFVGEQVGPPEQRLKARLIDFFKRDQSVTKAYLARVDFGNGNPVGVALCLRTLFGTDKGMVEKIGTIFASAFNAQEHLDIIFLTDEQEASLVKVCQPFFG